MLLKHAFRVAIFWLRKAKVTYDGGKIKRYSGSERTRSPMTGNSKAIFRLHKHKGTYACETAKRYFGSERTRSPTWKSASNLKKKIRPKPDFS